MASTDTIKKRMQDRRETLPLRPPSLRPAVRLVDVQCTFHRHRSAQRRTQFFTARSQSSLGHRGGFSSEESRLLPRALPLCGLSFCHETKDSLLPRKLDYPLHHDIFPRLLVVLLTRAKRRTNCSRHYHATVNDGIHDAYIRFYATIL